MRLYCPCFLEGLYLSHPLKLFWNLYSTFSSFDEIYFKRWGKPSASILFVIFIFTMHYNAWTFTRYILENIDWQKERWTKRGEVISVNCHYRFLTFCFHLRSVQRCIISNKKRYNIIGLYFRETWNTGNPYCIYKILFLSSTVTSMLTIFFCLRVMSICPSSIQKFLLLILYLAVIRNKKKIKVYHPHSIHSNTFWNMALWFPLRNMS